MRALAYEIGHPPARIERVAESLGWQGSEFLVPIDELGDVISTMNAASDLDAAVRIGDVRRPRLALLRALYGSRRHLLVTQVTPVEAPWDWRRVGSRAVQGVVMRQHTYWDTHEAFSARGLACRVVADTASTEELVAAARDAGSVVVDTAEEYDGEALARPEELCPAVTFGLLERAERPAPTYFWLTLTAHEEQPGLLVGALSTLAAAGVDLDFLHSDDLNGGRHCFHLGFRGERSSVEGTMAELRDQGFEWRLLGSFHE